MTISEAILDFINKGATVKKSAYVHNAYDISLKSGAKKMIQLGWMGDDDNYYISDTDNFGANGKRLSTPIMIASLS